MKVIQVPQPASLDSLRLVECDQPTPSFGEILVRVRASSLNFHDYLVVAGMLPVDDGRIPMSDGAGEVAAVTSPYKMTLLQSPIGIRHCQLRRCCRYRIKIHWK